MRSPLLALLLLAVGGLFGVALTAGARELEEERHQLRPGRPSDPTERVPQRAERRTAPRPDPPARPQRPRIEYRESVAVGSPSRRQPRRWRPAPPGVVVPLVNHDNHLHVRLPPG